MLTVEIDWPIPLSFSFNSFILNFERPQSSNQEASFSFMV